MKNSVLDTSEWREFRLTDLFEISGSKTTPKIELEHVGEGIYPYVTTQATCNGIAGYYAISTERGHCLTIDSAVLGVCFYQEKDFSASDHVEILRPKFTMSKEVAIFFTILLNKTGIILGYAYDKKRSQRALKQEIIKLPTDSKGKIDWDFMEKSIKETKKEAEKILQSYKALKASISGGGGIATFILTDYLKHSQATQAITQEQNFINEALMQLTQKSLNALDSSGWQEFRLNKLFFMKRGKRLIKSDRKAGDIPYYSASNTNNGLTDRISNPLFIESDKIIISTFGDAYFVEGKFTASDEITILGHDKLNKYNALFIVAVIKKYTSKFAFDCKAFSGKLQEQIITLPTDSKGEPDFEFMENFIKNIEQEHSHKLLAYHKALQTSTLATNGRGY